VHIPVLAGPVIEWLRVRPTGTYVDCTAGAGGHAALVAERLTTGRLIALDRDPAAVALASERLSPYPQAMVCHRNYSELAAVLAELGVDNVDGVLVDAGVSSMQLDQPRRGFSFQAEGPLDMRMDTTQGATAAQWLASTDMPTLMRSLRTYGDVGPAKRIASAILRRSDREGLETCQDLVAAVCEALPFVSGVPEEVRQVFQAVRIAVNDELGALKKGLDEAVAALAPHGRVVAIAFHSGEDRIVKNVLRDAARRRRELYPDGRVKAVEAPILKVLTKKPVQPDAEEARANPRSRSARLRAAERLAEPEEAA
jgi:16S rRNA (cytosine1402-N4)-methyltransferase